MEIETTEETTEIVEDTETVSPEEQPQNPVVEETEETESSSQPEQDGEGETQSKDPEESQGEQTEEVTGFAIPPVQSTYTRMMNAYRNLMAAQRR